VESRYLGEAGMPAERCAPLENAGDTLLNDMGFSSIRGEFGPDEEAFARNFFESYRLSHSDLETFLEDPRSFFRRVILRAPFDGNVHTKFGKAYHAAIEHFTREYKKSGHVPSVEWITKSFAKTLSQEILSPEEYDRLLARGTEGLAGWHREYGSRDPTPLEIEYSLSRKEITIDGVPVSGKIDAILPGSSDDAVLLIDYKTGATKSENALRGLTASDEPRYFRQVMMYRLMIERDPRFASKRVETAIEFAEGRDGKYARIPLEATDEELAEFRSLLVESWAKISSMDFWREELSDKGPEPEEK
jgi:DNA helicase II / ATP-dependent DNA helicase PcrA